jgi:hypothetical protein
MDPNAPPTQPPYPDYPVRQSRIIYVQPRQIETSNNTGAVIAVVSIVLLIITIFIIALTAPATPAEPATTYTTTVVTSSETPYWDDGVYVFLGILFILPIIVVGLIAASMDDNSRPCAYQSPYMRAYDFNGPMWYPGGPQYRRDRNDVIVY